MPFDLPTTPHPRAHGPGGYLDYRSFKEWLRDEFAFHFAYCLFRERWYPSGASAFGADHVTSQASAPSRATDYDNLAYACVRCNALKGSNAGLPDPCRVAFGRLLRVTRAGRVVATGPRGRPLIDVLRLNDPGLVEWRRLIIREHGAWMRDGGDDKDARATWFKFPRDLPNLSRLRPPHGNRRPAGIRNSWHAKRRRGELPATY